MGSHRITVACTDCGQCFLICPVGAIVTPPEGGYIIDAEVCIDCSHCIAVCGAHAIQGVPSPFDQS